MSNVLAFHTIKSISSIAAEYLLADKGYDSDAIVVQAERQNITAGVPPRKNRKVQRQ